MTKLILLIFVSILIQTVLSVQYLTEKPDYLPEACSIKDPKFNECSVKSLQSAFNQMGKGIPGLKTLPRTDPYYIKKVKLIQNNDAATFDVELVNITAKGFSKVAVRDNVVQEKDYSWKTKFFIPRLVLDGDYKINGRLLALTLKGHGKIFLDMENIDIKMFTKVKLYEKGGFTFGNVSECKIDFKIGGLKLKLDNLFNGAVELEENLNVLLNENWMDFVEAMRPAISQMIESILLDNMRKVFHFIPAKYFISDIPTSEQLYGKKNT